MQEYVVLVDANDNPIGLMEKMEAHVKAELHRAFSIFIFNTKGEMLLQQRAFSKYHTPGLWTNTCCSHPRENETVKEAAIRRLKEEVAIEVNDLEEIHSFVYHYPFDNGLTEFEMEHGELRLVMKRETAAREGISKEVIINHLSVYREHLL